MQCINMLTFLKSSQLSITTIYKKLPLIMSYVQYKNHELSLIMLFAFGFIQY
jgi:hypothetical protein